MESQQIVQFLPPCKGFLYDVTRKILPAIFVVLFVASGTGVLILNMGFNKPVPFNYLAGVAITFGVVIALIAIGNFLLYARKQISQIRSTSNSARSSTGCEGEVRYLTWKHHLVKYEDRQRAFVREFFLRKESKKNSKKILVANVEDIDSHIDSNSYPEGITTPVDNKPLVERGRTREERTFPKDLNLTGRSAIETTRAMPELELSGADGNRIMMSRGNRHRKHNSADIQATSGVSAATTKNRLPDTDPGSLEGLAARVERTSSSALHTTLTKPLLPEDVLKEHALYSRAWKRPGASQIQQNDIVDHGIVPELSTDGNISDIPTIPATSSDIQVLCLEIVQQEVERANPEAPYVEQRKFDSHRTSIDRASQSLKDGEEFRYLKYR